jgi:HEAT repeat protein
MSEMHITPINTTLNTVLLQMIMYLKDEAWQVRRMAVDAIAAINKVENRFVQLTLEHLIPLLKEDEPISFAAISALERIAQYIRDDNLAPLLVEQLFPLLEADDVDIKYVAASAIGDIIRNSIGMDDKIVLRVINQLRKMQVDEEDLYGNDVADCVLEQIKRRIV